MKTHKAMLLVNGIGILAVSVLNYFFQANQFDYTIKCICSSCFTVFGLLNLVYALKRKASCPKFYWTMGTGVVFAMLGDVFIYHSFILGAGAFAIGHICFFIAYCFLQKFTLTDFIPSGVLFTGALLFLLFCPVLTFDEPIFKPVCIIYAAIISAMTGKSFTLFLSKKTLFNGIVFSGSFLFFLSDLLLVLKLFADIGDWPYHGCITLYYPSVCLLALSMLLKVMEKKGAQA
ncbi:MAG: hypothetical protein IJZ55_04675 [Lachnospiraceae bacterium]|nr:hypothetical protein [Lachnospiraceae bacterium]